MSLRLTTLTAIILLVQFASAQVSVDEAMSRLREKQAKRQTTTQPATRAGDTLEKSPQVRQVTGDTLAALGEFVKTADDALNSGDQRNVKLDAGFARVLDLPFRLTAKAQEVTGKVPIGDAGLFGDRPDQALVVSLPLVLDPAPLKPSLMQGRTTIADLYLVASDEYLKVVQKGMDVRGRVIFSRVEIDPADAKSAGRLYVAKLKLLGQFEPDIPWRPLAAAAPPAAPTPPRADPLAPVTASIPSPQRGGSVTSKKIIFICDASGSMLQKFDALKVQLSRTVHQLAPGESFNVIFFQVQNCIPLSEKLLAASPDAKRQSDEFLESIVPKGETNPLPALDLAFKQQPDLIFLLTDGDFPDNKAVLKHIRELERRRKVRINTVAFVASNDRDTDFVVLLKAIAGETGGSYRFVRATDL